MIVSIQEMYFDRHLPAHTVATQLGVGYSATLKYLHRDGRPKRRNFPPSSLGRSTLQRAPTEHPTLMQIAWAAGWFDGEGCIQGAMSKHGTAYVAVSLTQKDRWICDRFQALFGGVVSGRKNRVIYDWRLTGARARGFLMTMYTFLSPRRQAKTREVFGRTELAKVA